MFLTVLAGCIIYPVQAPSRISDSASQVHVYAVRRCVCRCPVQALCLLPPSLFQQACLLSFYQPDAYQRQSNLHVLTLRQQAACLHACWLQAWSDSSICCAWWQAQATTIDVNPTDEQVARRIAGATKPTAESRLSC